MRKWSTRKQGIGNGSKGGAFFNGKHDKHKRGVKGFDAPVYSPDTRKHPGTPTSRFSHKPWPFKRKKEVAA